MGLFVPCDTQSVLHNHIENDSNDSIIPAFLVNQPNRILFPDNFVLQEQIGKGSFGNILKVFNKLDNQFYALKNGCLHQGFPLAEGNMKKYMIIRENIFFMIIVFSIH